MTSRKVKLPHNNRVNASIVLRTNNMWANTIGGGAVVSSSSSSRDLETEEQLLQLAKLAKSGGGENRGTCSKCNQLGHLSFQCRNSVKPIVKDISSSSSDSDDDDINDSIANRKRVRSNSKSPGRDEERKEKKHKKEKKHSKKEKHKKDKHKKEKHKKDKH